MAKPIIPTFKRGVDSALNGTSIEHGTVRVITDTGRLMFDLDGSRIEITDFVKKTDSEIKAIIAPLMKFYYATDTHKIYVYDNGWTVVGDSASNADKLSTERTISLRGDVSGSGKFDGSSDLNITTEVADDSHSHSAKTLPAATSSVKGVMTLGASGGAATYGHTHGAMGGASSGAAGSAGFVPAPAAGDQNKVLNGAGKWVNQTPAYTHPTSGVTAGTYKSVTVDVNGHVTAGSNPTTLAGYGITDAAKKSHTHAISEITNLQTTLDGKAPSNHNHDASEITSGVLDIARIPKAAIPSIKYVTDDTARFALTVDDIQNGDTVKVTSTGKMYYVKDDTNLNSESGYEPYTADIASSVPWSGITGKPTTYTPSSHSHAISEITNLQTTLDDKASSDHNHDSKYAAKSHTHTISEITNLQTTLDGKAPSSHSHSTMTGATSDTAGAAGFVPVPAAGDQNKVLNGAGNWVEQTPPYTHPTSGVVAGTYKSVTVDENGHVTAGSNPTTLAEYGIIDAADKEHTHTLSDITDFDFGEESEYTVE